MWKTHTRSWGGGGVDMRRYNISRNAVKDKLF